MKKSHPKIVKNALKKTEVLQAYNAMEEEFSLLKTMLEAREKAKKTQAEVAKIMKTTTSVIGRLETGGGTQKHSPTLATLKKYADALDCKLSIKFIPIHTDKKV